MHSAKAAQMFQLVCGKVGTTLGCRWVNGQMVNGQMVYGQLLTVLGGWPWVSCLLFALQYLLQGLCHLLHLFLAQERMHGER